MKRCVAWLLFSAVLLCVSGCESKQERLNREAIPKVKKDLPPLIEKLKVVVNKLPDPKTLEPISCPEDLIPPKKVSHSSMYHRVHMIHEPTLRQLIDLHATPRKGEFKPDSLLTTSEWNRLLEDPAKRPYSIHYGYNKVTVHNLMGVALEGEYSFGEFVGKKISKPAWYRGWFLLFDWKEGKLLAAFPVEGASRTQLTVMVQRGHGVDWPEELRDAASDNVMIGIEQGMRKYCPMVEIQTNYF
jgi:hypothetical protein